MSPSKLRGDLLKVLYLIFLIGCGIYLYRNSRSGMPSFPRHTSSKLQRSFTIDFDNDTFLMDGRPFRFVSGEFHYFRTPRGRWRDILRKIRAAGLNAVSTYTEWSLHESTQGIYDFTGDRNIELFIEMAAQEGLYVLLRPGPFICGERDFGGLPPWLLTKPGIQLRRSDETYQHFVSKWYFQLFTRLQRFTYGNGGPIIMVQVENEYGMVSHCDLHHVTWLRDLIKSFIHNTAVLYSIDPPYKWFHKCTVDGVYTTVDFGPWDAIDRSFIAQRKIAQRGPLVNAEYYTGWLTHWGETSMRYLPPELVTEKLDQMLSLGANVNIYMFFGGTNFGFKNGANIEETPELYMPTVTSYDYDSPLDESGDPTEKYFQIKEVVQKYMKVPNSTAPAQRPKGAYEKAFLTPTVSLFDSAILTSPIQSKTPLTFEQLGQNYGFVLYETTLTEELYCETCKLGVKFIRDRAQVFINEDLVGILYRAGDIELTVNVTMGQKLSLLVENMGRINHDKIYDRKGILSEVLLDNEELLEWKMYKLPLKNIRFIESLQPSGTIKYPMFFTGIFEISSKPLDTFLDMRQWSKGVVFINGHNLGRYWSQVGPQYSLFVPLEFLRVGTNRITVFEMTQAPESFAVEFGAKSLNRVVSDDEKGGKHP